MNITGLCFLLLSAASYAQPGVAPEIRNLYANRVSVHVDSYPVFPGGPQKMKQFLRAKLRQLDCTSEDKNTLYFSCDVDTAGRLKNIKLVNKGVPDQYRRCLVKAFRSMPAWKPALNEEGRKLAMFVIVPYNPGRQKRL